MLNAQVFAPRRRGSKPIFSKGAALTQARRFKRRVLSAVLGGLLLCGAQAAQADVFEVDQLIDLSAMTPDQVYRFDPDYLWIEPGDTVRFLNSTGNHTVTSIEGMWPEGAALVSIEHQPVADITLAAPGVYGFRCKVHGRHGMYALVVVGSPDANIEQIEYTNVGDVGRRVFERLFERMREEMADRTE